MLEIDDQLKLFVASDKLCNDKDALYGFAFDIINEGIEKIKQFNNDMMETIEGYQRKQEKKSRRLQNISLMQAHLGAQENKPQSNESNQLRGNEVPKPPNQGVNLLQGNVDTFEMKNLINMANQDPTEIKTVTNE